MTLLQDLFAWYNVINCHENPMSMSLKVTFVGPKLVKVILKIRCTSKLRSMPTVPHLRHFRYFKPSSDMFCLVLLHNLHFKNYIQIAFGEILRYRSYTHKMWWYINAHFDENVNPGKYCHHHNCVNFLLQSVKTSLKLYEVQFDLL